MYMGPDTKAPWYDNMMRYSEQSLTYVHKDVVHYMSDTSVNGISQICDDAQDIAQSHWKGATKLMIQGKRPHTPGEP
jgi:hypothetical protein